MNQCAPRIYYRAISCSQDILSSYFWLPGYDIKLFLAPRMYYQARSNLPMLPDEVENDSKQEEDTLEWHKMCSQKVSGLTWYLHSEVSDTELCG